MSRVSGMSTVPAMTDMTAMSMHAGGPMVPETEQGHDRKAGDAECQTESVGAHSRGSKIQRTGFGGFGRPTLQVTGVGARKPASTSRNASSNPSIRSPT